MTNPDKKKKRNRVEIPKDESKVVTFKRVVVPRVRKALKAIKLIGNCSTSGYAYNEEDIRKIFSEIYEQVKAAENRFKGQGTTDNSFSL